MANIDNYMFTRYADITSGVFHKQTAPGKQIERARCL